MPIGRKPAAAAAKKAPVALGIAEPKVVESYKAAAKIANETMKTLIDACQPGAKVLDLCTLGDKTMADSLAKVDLPAETAKGIAFPTTVTPNQLVAHLSPMKESDDATMELKDGDLVKLQLGVQIDGYPALVGHSLVVGQNSTQGRKADVLLAAHYAAEVALRMFTPGTKNMDVTQAVQKAAQAYETVPAEGMLSTEMSQNKVYGEKAVILNPSTELRRSHKVAKIEAHEVYQVDITVCTGDGKPRETEHRTTVFHKSGTRVGLKMQTSRTAFTEVIKRFPHFPFTLRTFSDERKGRLGMIECRKTGVVVPHDIFTEKEGELVAQFQFTVLVHPDGPEKITGAWFDPASAQSDKKIEDEELLKLLAN
ncbi:Proliferation-associated protein 2G4 [Dimargaris xerosporica]|nr:Proliferation-associated protein 2G4 [Dimargaris xerosporica]